MNSCREHQEAYEEFAGAVVPRTVASTRRLTKASNAILSLPADEIADCPSQAALILMMRRLLLANKDIPGRAELTAKSG